MKIDSLNDALTTKLQHGLTAKAVRLSQKWFDVLQEACVGEKHAPVFSGIPVTLVPELVDGYIIEWSDGSLMCVSEEVGG